MLITNLQDTDIKLKTLEKSIEKLTITKNTKKYINLPRNIR